MKKLIYFLMLAAAVLAGCNGPDEKTDNTEQQPSGGNGNGENGGENGNGENGNGENGNGENGGGENGGGENGGGENGGGENGGGENGGDDTRDYVITGAVVEGDMGFFYDDLLQSDYSIFGFWQDGAVQKNVSISYSYIEDGAIHFDLKSGELPAQTGTPVYFVCTPYNYDDNIFAEDGTWKADFSRQANGPQFILLGKGSMQGDNLYVEFKQATAIVRISSLGGFSHGESSARVKLSGSNFATDATVRLEGGDLKLVPGSARELLDFSDYRKITDGALDTHVFALAPVDGVSSLRISARSDQSHYLYETVLRHSLSGTAGKYVELGDLTMEPAGVQLYTVGRDSPYWAFCNVGASTPKEEGLLFSWGNVDGHTGYNYWFDDSNYGIYRRDLYPGTPGSTLAGNYDAYSEYDAAHVNMGGTWFTPSKMQLEDLMNSCDVTHNASMTGLVFSGKGSYAGLSIELPFNDLSGNPDPRWQGYYWSRTYYGVDYLGSKAAYLLYVSKDDPTPFLQVSTNSVDYPGGVRAISY